MAGDPGSSISQTDDNSNTADRGGANVRVNLVGFDKPLITACALGLSVASILFTLWLDFDQTNKWRADQQDYALWVDYVRDLTTELQNHGLKIPPNPCKVKGACP